MFVVFEGIDGSGKTTISNRVAGKLREAGISVEHLREGGKFSSRVTQGLREFGRDARNLELAPLAELFLYVTRDVQLLEEVTRPALGRADVVIADRFLYSAEVLSRFGRGLSEDAVRPVLQAAARGLEPDLVVLVDVDPHIARARRQLAKVLTQDKRPPSRKGLAGVGIQHRFREGYLELAGRNPRRWVIVDNDGDLDATIQQVFALMLDAVRSGVPTAIDQFRKEVPTAQPLPGPLASPAEALAAFLSWIDDRTRREPNVAAYFLGGLCGPGVDERRQTLAPLAPETIAGGLGGLDDEVSWALREALLAKAAGRVARSLSGLPGGHARARALREHLADQVPVDVLASLDTVDDDDAWASRERLRLGASALVADALVGSVTRIGGERAWAVREEWLVARGGVDALATYEVARVACKAVASLDDERAWRWRKAARDVAPIAAVGSLSHLFGERAWKWRERWLPHAPKAVFGTLRRCDDPRAWRMREEMAALCKEAIDSLQDLDDPRAWTLRERCADVWPSTVVKSLGPLAGSARGRALLERQLRKYPENVSLLKHAAEIAVGANLLSSVE